MSYRPPEQSIAEPARKLIENITEFCAAADARMQSEDWNSDHIDDLASLHYILTDAQCTLVSLARENW